MHGFIFLKLKEFAEHECGTDWGSLVSEAGIEDGEFQFDQTYPDEEWQTLVNVLSKKAGRPEENLLARFGVFLTPELFEIGRFMSLIREDWGILDLIENLSDSVHGALRAADPLFNPPRLKGVRVKSDEVVVFYRSSQKRCALLKGILQGAADHYGEAIRIADDKCVLNGDSCCRLTVSLQAARKKRGPVFKMLGRIMEKSIPLQVFNIYKGVPVAGSATITSVSKEGTTLEVSRYQAISMKLSGETFLKSPAFPRNVRAEVGSVDTSKGRVKLLHFSFIESEIGMRQLVRVSPKTPITAEVRFEGSEVKGELANISYEGAAFHLSEPIEIHEDSDFNPKVTFRLPVRESGEKASEEEVKLCGSISGVYAAGSKHVLRLYFGETGREVASLIRRYIAQRQMEIVREFHYYI